MIVRNVPEKYQLNNVWHQYYAVIAANLVAISHGCALGWVSPALPILASDDTPLQTGPLTNDEISWIGSISCIGGLIGALCYGHITTLLGSKRGVLLLAAPVILFWLLIYFGTTYYHIFIARFIAGITNGGLQSSIILFICEIANDDVRGRLGSFTLFFRNIGTLIGYILGASVSYESVPYISSMVPIIFVAIFSMMPDTPQYLLKHGNNQEAENAFKFYKGYKGTNELEDKAISKEFERLKAIVNERKLSQHLNISDFFDRKALLGLGIGVALNVFCQLTACFTIMNYSVMTFMKLGIHMDPHVSSISLALSLIFGSLTTTYLADKLGRKTLILFSLMGSAFGLFATALYYYFSLLGYELSEVEWIQVFSLSIVIFLPSAGITPLAIICSVEYLPTKVRTYGVAIICSSLNLATFISTKMYPILLAHLDLHGTFSIYGFCCIIGFVFVFFVLKETSGKSLDDVDEKSKFNYQKRLSIP